MNHRNRCVNRKKLHCFTIHSVFIMIDIIRKVKSRLKKNQFFFRNHRGGKVSGPDFRKKRTPGYSVRKRKRRKFRNTSSSFHSLHKNTHLSGITGQNTGTEIHFTMRSGSIAIDHLDRKSAAGFCVTPRDAQFGIDPIPASVPKSGYTMRNATRYSAFSQKIMTDPQLFPFN